MALVTGASRGLGYLIARRLAERGHRVMVCARSVEGVEAAAADLGGDAVGVAADVGDRSDAERVVQEALGHFGRLDVLVCNAGVIQVGPFSAIGPEEYAAAMDVMFWGIAHPVFAALPELRRRRGRILAVTSLGGKIPAPHLLPYVAAKYAAVGFAEGLRVELAAEGVSVTVGVPGLMRTGSPRNALFAGDSQAEYEWFAGLGSLPLLSMDAERAARRLVDGTLRGRPEIVLTPAAKLAMRAHGVAPATMLRLLSVGNRILPSGGQSPPRPGHETREPAWLQALTRLNRVAARRFHQFDDPT